MLFNSLEFLVFFPMVVAFYFLIPHRFRWILLLLASYYFYMCWSVKYVALLLFTTIICYFAAIGIYRSNNKGVRLVLLITCVGVYLGTLFFFKYFNFFSESVNAVFAKFNLFYNVPTYQFLLPVGISFYTFQAIGYTVDVYRGNIKPEYHFGKFALFKSFFPQLVAGPIERASNLLPQFSQKFSFNYERIRDGIVLMAWGFFKKVVIADRLAEYVNIVYNDPTHHYGIPVILATVFFAFQIYCDFSGYSDIAVGSAKILGFNLMINFRRPYFAVNIKEFWQRWHISLSTWFRDYFYISIGGNRVAVWRWQVNLFLTFLVSGIWHGANWTFVIWGALHGFYLVFALWTKNLRLKANKLLGLDSNIKLNRVISVLITFVLVTFAWIFFRANSVADAFVIIRNMFDFTVSDYNLYRIPADFYVAIASVILLIGIEIWIEYPAFSERIYSLQRPYKWALFSTLILSILILGKWESIDFLYFQF